MSNYPPGVTGGEFAIAGPDFETEERHWCRRCDAERDGLLYGFGPERWWVCDECGSEEWE